MYSPQPYGLSVRNGELTEKDRIYVDSVVRRFLNFKETSKLENLRKYYDLPDGGYFIVQFMGGIFQVLAFKDPDIENLILDGIAKSYVPMLFSGVITKSIVAKGYSNDDGEGVGIYLTEQSRSRIAQYDQGKKVNEQVTLLRFAIDYADAFAYFRPKIEGIYLYTQYLKHRPTWYSGSMAAVMQIIAGYGRQDFSNLPDNKIERVRFLIPEVYKKRIEEDLKDVRLPGYSGIPATDGAFQYDYKFSKTHAISFDQAKQPWLIQIDSSGVWAMPLPLVPATTTDAFREYIEEKGDEELLAILDAFGGMPSGESFPIESKDFYAWKRAGVIIKVCDTADFYQYSNLYTACGWSFNTQGSEGFNTCWGYASNGLLYVHAYKMKLKLGAALQQGKVGKVEVSGSDAVRLSTYLSKLFEYLDNDATGLAIKYKLRKLKYTQLLERATTVGSVDQNEVNYWDSLEINPIANHSGSVSKVSTGPVYWELKQYPQSMGRLKFPELTAQGCESFMMVSPDYEGGFVKCDTIMWGCYVQDELKVVKYFIDNRKFTKEIASSFEDIMIVGSWEKTEVGGETGLMGYFYTTDFDDRQEAPPVTTYTKLQGNDLGYSNPAYQTPPLLYVRGTVSRARYYQHVTKIKTTSSFSIDCGICVPVYNRDSLLYSYKDMAGEVTIQKYNTLGAIPDPTSYELWTYDPIFHYIGQAGKGEPFPTIGDYVYIDKKNYVQTETSDFADSGDWLGLGSGYLDVSGLCAPYTIRSSIHNGNGVVLGGEAPSIDQYNTTTTEAAKETGRVSVSYDIASASRVHQNIPESWYFSFSPIESGGSLSYFYRDACKVTFGMTQYANISEGQDIHGRRKRYGSCRLVDDQSAYFFIGVINE